MTRDSLQSHSPFNSTIVFEVRGYTGASQDSLYVEAGFKRVENYFTNAVMH